MTQKHGVKVYDYRTDEEKAQPLDVSRWQLSPWAKWAAAESCGSVFEHECKPHVDRDMWAYGGRCMLIGTISMTGIDWRQTLTAVNVGLHAQPCNLPEDICRGHDDAVPSQSERHKRSLANIAAARGVLGYVDEPA